MDISAIIAFISPFLPYLVNLGRQSTEKLTEKASEQFSETAWQKAQVVWQKLHPKVRAKAAATEAIEDVVANPNDEEMQTVLRVQLKKLLQQDTELAHEIAGLLKADGASEPPQAQLIQDVIGNKNQVIGSSQGTVIYQNQ